MILVLQAAALRPAPAMEPVLPPEIPWSGKSESLALSPGDRWATPAEREGFLRSPRYPETVAWLESLAAAAPEVRLVPIGASPEGRRIWMAIASREGASTAESLRRTGRPTLLVQGGIHAGEIDGKDAGLMLLRDLAVRGGLRELLDRANLLLVPIFNVDGHEQVSAYTRVNQRGPAEPGWRVTARRLNLNRDYSKMDAPEMRAMVEVLNAYDPDLYLDVHVTDGLDYAYDVTFGFTGTQGHSPAIAGWLEERLAPALRGDLEAMGHIPGPLVSLRDDADPGLGIDDWTASPRFSNGYGDARHLPTVLVETHSLKPFRQRVLGTRVFLESALRTLGREGERLRRAIAADRARRPAEVALDWKRAAAPAGFLDFPGIESVPGPDTVLGKPARVFTGRPGVVRIPRFGYVPASTATRPRAYWIPAAWEDVIERLGWHGIRMERIREEREVQVDLQRILEPRLAPEPFEGRVRVEAKLEPVPARRVFPAGSARVATDQPLGDLAILLLEPGSPDSFFQWGFFLEILQRVEYAEAYVLAPAAERMLAENPRLREEFERALESDPSFAADPAARVDWFYRRMPWLDPGWRVYPVGRER